MATLNITFFSDFLAMHKNLLIAFTFALLSTLVQADSLVDDLSNDKVLEGAAAEIRKMQLRELDIAIEYIAACMEPLTTERNYHCGRHSTIASIKIDKAPQFSRLIKAVFIAEVRSKDPKEKGSMESIGSSLIEIRRSTIFSTLQDVARERYQKLAK